METKEKRSEYIEKHVKTPQTSCIPPCRPYLESEVERLKVALHVLQLDEARGVDGVSVHKGGRRHHAADESTGDDALTFKTKS